MFYIFEVVQKWATFFVPRILNRYTINALFLALYMHKSSEMCKKVKEKLNCICSFGIFL